MRTSSFVLLFAIATATAADLCDDSCLFSLDDECDDGGEGSTFFFCDPGTDCSDCNPFDQLTDSDVRTMNTSDTTQPTSTPTATSYCIDGNWPLFLTEAAAKAASPTDASHTHTLRGATFHMPSGRDDLVHDFDSTTSCPDGATTIPAPTAAPTAMPTSKDDGPDTAVLAGLGTLAAILVVLIVGVACYASRKAKSETRGCVRFATLTRKELSIMAEAYR